MPPPMPHFVPLIQAFKAEFLDVQESGDLPPILLIERDGAIDHILVVASAANPYEALPLVELAAAVLPHDALVLVIESRVRRLRDGQPHPERGELQRLAEAGKAGEHGIVDVLNAVRIDADGRRSLYTLPYLYSGPQTPFAWLTSQFTAIAPGDGEVGGELPAALAEVSARTKFRDVTEMIERLAPDRAIPRSARLDLDDPERARQILISMTLHFLEQSGCEVFTSLDACGSLKP